MFCLRLFCFSFVACFLFAGGLIGGEVPSHFGGGLVFLEVRALGCERPLAFLLDSGAGSSVIDLSLAQRLGVRLGAGVNVHGVQGTAAARWVDGFVGTSAGVSLPSSLLGLDLASLRAACRRNLDGILGLDFLRGRVVQIDYGRQRVCLLERGGSERRGEEFRLVARNDALCVRALVEGTPRLLRVDTGCDSSLQCMQNAGGGGVRSPTLAAQTGARQDGPITLQLGALRLPDVRIGRHAGVFFPGEDGLLGGGLLSRFIVTLDAAGRRLYLAAPGGGLSR